MIMCLIDAIMAMAINGRRPITYNIFSLLLLNVKIVKFYSRKTCVLQLHLLTTPEHRSKMLIDIENIQWLLMGHDGRLCTG